MPQRVPLLRYCVRGRNSPEKRAQFAGVGLGRYVNGSVIVFDRRNVAGPILSALAASHRRYYAGVIVVIVVSISEVLNMPAMLAFHVGGKVGTVLAFHILDFHVESLAGIPALLKVAKRWLVAVLRARHAHLHPPRSCIRRFTSASSSTMCRSIRASTASRTSSSSAVT